MFVLEIVLICIVIVLGCTIGYALTPAVIKIVERFFRSAAKQEEKALDDQADGSQEGEKKDSEIIH